ncbi:MAG: hypothetical protein O7C75_14920 [Verrucomicrobia bacterium]|nr:hypothetical protein [Verrucomicrobiota bacterium]
MGHVFRDNIFAWATQPGFTETLELDSKSVNGSLTLNWPARQLFIRSKLVRGLLSDSHGLSELDIPELGRWSITAMVKRYSRAYTFEDAASRYKAIV